MYVKWKKYFHFPVQVIPMEYAGRGSRASENHYLSFNELINDFYSKITSEITTGTPYVLFGYSMGGLVAYELYRRLRENGYAETIHLFIAAREAPDTRILKVDHLNKTFLTRLVARIPARSPYLPPFPLPPFQATLTPTAPALVAGLYPSVFQILS